VPRLIFAPRALDDLERVAALLASQAPADAARTVPLIVGALRILRDHPLLGRPAEHGLRELVVSRGRSGYVALYRYRVDIDAVVVLAVQHQHEAPR
jgi:plasmid stabilization system protein ParE